VFQNAGGAKAANALDNNNGRSRDDRPVYQRHAFDGGRRDDRRDRRDFRRGYPMLNSPPISSGSFQRPYPYHLDYYKMRYGGSYAPYFGNLYGPSYPAYYGPYYGGYGFGGGYANGFEQPGYGGGPMEYPVGAGMLMQPGPVEPAEVVNEATTVKPQANVKAEGLPVPTP